MRALFQFMTSFARNQLLSLRFYSYNSLDEMTLRKRQFTAGPILQLESRYKGHNLGVMVTTSAGSDVNTDVVYPTVCQTKKILLINQLFYFFI